MKPYIVDIKFTIDELFPYSSYHSIIIVIFYRYNDPSLQMEENPKTSDKPRRQNREESSQRQESCSATTICLWLIMPKIK